MITTGISSQITEIIPQSSLVLIARNLQRLKSKDRFQRREIFKDVSISPYRETQIISSLVSRKYLLTANRWYKVHPGKVDASIQLISSCIPIKAYKKRPSVKKSSFQIFFKKLKSLFK